MLRPDLQQLVKLADTSGWAVGVGRLEDLRVNAHAFQRWREVPVRAGDSPTQRLKPHDAENARRNTLTAQYGKGKQPLHTDGAHHREPPDYIVLFSASPNSTPTRLWKYSISNSGLSFDKATNGVFLVNNGESSFFALAQQNRRLRYDPGCMTPCDQRARELSAEIATVTDAEAVDHHWTRDNEILLINNALALHGRAAVSPDDDDRELVRVAYRKAD